MQISRDQCFNELKKFGWLYYKVLFDKDDVAGFVYDHILTHKWFLNEKIPFEVSFDQAVQSWYELVYLPLVEAMRSTLLLDVLEKSELSRYFSRISGAYYFASLNWEPGEEYPTYDKICSSVLFSIKGHWLTKVRSFFIA